MNITQSWRNLRVDLNTMTANDYLETSQPLVINKILVTAQHYKNDQIGQELSPGDIVAFSPGAANTIVIGILLGFTKEGYRCAKFNNAVEEHNRTLACYLFTPHTVFRVQSKEAVII